MIEKPILEVLLEGSGLYGVLETFKQERVPQLV